MKTSVSALLLILLMSSCIVTRKPADTFTEPDALSVLLENPALLSAHVGVSIYDVERDSLLVNYQGDKYFVPASNTKIVTCYTSMQWLGDSSLTFLVAENDTAVFVQPAGDPSFLHRDFARQPVMDWLKAQTKPVYFSDQNWKSKHWGSGWAWSDYDEAYMPERSAMPVYGNTIRWEQAWAVNPLDEEMAAVVASDPPTEWPVNFSIENENGKFKVNRALSENLFTIIEGKEDNPKVDVPFVTYGIKSALEILSYNLEKPMHYWDDNLPAKLSWKPMYSQPIDSILKPMMNRSDNFFAEQLLLMVSHKMSGKLNERIAIDSMFKTSLADLPGTARWADGSGLSRYNLFTPRDFVTILKKMRNEVGMERIKAVFPAGGRGTLSSYYVADEPYLYAKTGTLAGVVALSGYLTGDDGKQYIFSVLVNNHRANAVDVRRAVEKYLIRFKEGKRR